MSLKLQSDLKENILTEQEELLNQLLEEIDRTTQINDTDKKSRGEIVDDFKGKLDRSIIEVLERKPQFITNAHEVKKWIKQELFIEKGLLKEKVNYFNTEIKHIFTLGKEYRNDISKQNQKRILFSFFILLSVFIGYKKIDSYFSSPEYFAKKDLKQKEELVIQKEENQRELARLMEVNYFPLSTELIQDIETLDKFLQDNAEGHTFIGNESKYIIQRVVGKKTIKYSFTERNDITEFGGNLQTATIEKTFQVHTRIINNILLCNVDQTVGGVLITYNQEEANQLLTQLFCFFGDMRTGYMNAAQKNIVDPKSSIDNIEKQFPKEVIKQ